MITLPLLFTLSLPAHQSQPITNLGVRFWIQTQFISAELMEEQLVLLLESLERKILNQQLNLVRTHITLGSFQGGTDYFNSSNISIVMLQLDN